MRDSTGIGNRNASGRIWAMTAGVAQWVRRQIPQIGDDDVGECNWGNIDTLMQGDIMMADQFENFDKSGAKSSALCFLDKFVPECAKVML